MFWKIELKDHIRVPPSDFNMPLEKSILNQIRNKFSGFISKDFGIVVNINAISSIGRGTIIPGDGASYYEAVFSLFTFKPDLHEVLLGEIKDIADFGVFISMGPMEGMIHISQTMDDLVSFSKDKALSGRESKRVLGVGDICKTRVIAVSYKDLSNPKFGLTIRQPGLGKLDCIEADEAKKSESEKVPEKGEKSEKPKKEKSKK